MDWDTYLSQSKHYNPRPLLVKASTYVHGKKALDLGAGALNDSRYLIDHGFDVLAVDSNASIESGDIPFVVSKLEEFIFETESFDLISAQYTLPFVERSSLKTLMDGIYRALRPQGIFTGQFFGIHDDWKDRPGVNVVSKEEVESLLKDYELLKFGEQEKDDMTAAGAKKHWHIFNIIARKV